MSTNLPYSSEVPDRSLRGFRDGEKHTPLEPIERALVLTLGVHLCIVTFLLGGTLLWSQIISLVLSIAEFSLALQTRRRIGRRGGPEIELIPWIKLRRFPIFWLGAALLALVVIQALNPGWVFHQGFHSWWVIPLPNITWLPTSVRAPLAWLNIWRDLLIGISVWLTTCAVWVGLMRRKSLRILLAVLTGNGLALCVLEGYQRISGSGRCPWPLTSLTSHDLTASFEYKNHAGGYLSLATFAAVALAMWHYDRGVRFLKKSTPAGVLTLAALALAVGVLFTFSRGAGLILAGGLLAFALWFAVRRKRHEPSGRSNRSVTVVVVLVFGVLALNTARNLDFSAVYQHFDELAEQGAQAETVWSRVLVHKAAGDMLREHWLRGVGAGSFGYVFPPYVAKYPEVYRGGANFWQHAHGDWWEVPIEVGFVGDVLLLASAGWWISWFARRRVLWNPITVPLLIGCLQPVVHAWFDLPFQCPAILITWCVLIAVAAKAVEE